MIRVQKNNIFFVIFPILYFLLIFTGNGFVISHDSYATYFFYKHASTPPISNLSFSPAEPYGNFYLIVQYLSLNPFLLFGIALGQIGFSSLIVKSTYVFSCAVWFSIYILIILYECRDDKERFVFGLVSMLLLLSDGTVLRQYNFDASLTLVFLLFIKIWLNLIESGDLIKLIHKLLVYFPLIIFGHVIYSTIFLIWVIIIISLSLILYIYCTKRMVIQRSIISNAYLASSIAVILAFGLFIISDVHAINYGLINFWSRATLDADYPFYGGFDSWRKFFGLVVPVNHNLNPVFSVNDANLYVGPIFILFLIGLWPIRNKNSENLFKLFYAFSFCLVALLTSKYFHSEYLYRIIPGMSVIRHAGYYSTLLKPLILVGVIQVCNRSINFAIVTIVVCVYLCFGCISFYYGVLDLKQYALVFTVILVSLVFFRSLIFGILLLVPQIISSLFTYIKNNTPIGHTLNNKYSIEANFGPIDQTYRIDTSLIPKFFKNIDIQIPNGTYSLIFNSSSEEICGHYKSVSHYIICDIRSGSTVLDFSYAVHYNEILVVILTFCSIVWLLTSLTVLARKSICSA